MAISITSLGAINGNGITGLGLTLGASVPSGAAIVVGITEASTSVVSGSMADNGGTGNTYTSLIGGDLNNVTTNGFIEVFGVKNTAGLASGKVITYTGAVTSSPKNMSAVYVTGVDTVTCFDSAAAAFAGGSSTTPSVTSGTPANSNNFAIGYAGSKAGGGFTQSAGGWASPPTVNSPGGTVINIFGGSLQLVGSGTITFHPTQVNNVAWGACIIELIALGGSTPTNITLTQQSWLWGTNLFSINATTDLPLTQQPWLWTGTPFQTNAKVNILLTQKAWQWIGNPISVGGSTIIILTQKSWSWLTQTFQINAKRVITLAQTTWFWTGNAFPGFTSAIAPLLKLMGLGK